MSDAKLRSDEYDILAATEVGDFVTVYYRPAKGRDGKDSSSVQYFDMMEIPHSGSYSGVVTRAKRNHVSIQMNGSTEEEIDFFCDEIVDIV